MALLRTRSCEMIREITLGRRYSEELDAAIAEHAPAGLTSAIVHHAEHHMPRLARRPFYKLYVGGGSLEANTSSIHPQLEELALAVSDLRTSGPVIWNVRRLHDAEIAQALRKIELPRIERLTAWGDSSLLAGLPGYVPT